MVALATRRRHCRCRPNPARSSSSQWTGRCFITRWSSKTSSKTAAASSLSSSSVVRLALCLMFLLVSQPDAAQADDTIIVLQSIPCVNYQAVQTEYSQAKAKWDAANPVCYDFSYSFQGFQVGLPQPQKQRIRDGQLLQDASEGRFDMMHFFEMIQSLCFRDCPAKGAHSCRIVYDETYGFPTTIVIDVDEWAADEERAYRIENFVLMDCETTSTTNVLGSEGSTSLVEEGDPTDTTNSGATTTEQGGENNDTAETPGDGGNDTTDSTTTTTTTTTTEEGGVVVVVDDNTADANTSPGGDDTLDTTTPESSSGDTTTTTDTAATTPAGGEDDTTTTTDTTTEDTTDQEGMDDTTDAATTPGGGDDTTTTSSTTTSRCADNAADLQRAFSQWPNPPCYNFVYVRETGGLAAASASASLVQVQVRNGVARNEQMSINDFMNMIQHDCLDKCMQDDDGAASTNSMNYKCNVVYDQGMGFPTRIDMQPMEEQEEEHDTTTTAAASSSRTASGSSTSSSSSSSSSSKEEDHIQISNLDVVECEEEPEKTTGAATTSTTTTTTTTGQQATDPSPPVTEEDEESSSGSGNSMDLAQEEEEEGPATTTSTGTTPDALTGEDSGANAFFVSTSICAIVAAAIGTVTSLV